MSKLSSHRWALGWLLALLACVAQAHGPRGVYVHRHGGWGYDPWVAPLVFGAAVGTTMYLSRPYPPVPSSTVIISNPPVVVMPNPAPATWVQGSGVPVAAPAEQYYCRESAQYFPVVQTCVSPWLVVNPQ